MSTAVYLMNAHTHSITTAQSRILEYSPTCDANDEQQRFRCFPLTKSVSKRLQENN